MEKKSLMLMIFGLFVCFMVVIASNASAGTQGPGIMNEKQGQDQQGQGQQGQNQPGDSSGMEQMGDTLDLFNVKGIKGGLIQVDQNIFYSTDTLDVSVVIPQSLTAVWDGTAECYVIIRLTDGSLLDPFAITVSEQTPDEPKTFVTLDLSATPLSEGEYQIALILVNAGGDPLSMADWYNGFNGMAGATKFEVKEQCDADDDDSDCDGLMDSSAFNMVYSSLTVETGSDDQVSITGGTEPYTAVSSDDTIATASITGSVATISGVAEGAATITISDANGGIAAVVAVTVEASASSFQ